MSDALIVGIISAAVSLVGIFISAASTRSAVTQKLDIQQSVMNNEITHINEEIKEMKVDIKNHNHYAQMFHEKIPVIKERLDGLTQRVEKLENK